MQRLTYELMRDHVRAIFAAVTGGELPSHPETRGSLPLPSGPEAIDLISRRFAELEAFARIIPEVASTLPPFAFTPLIDILDRERELVIELAVPGVNREDVNVDVSGGVLVVSGVRAGEPTNGHVFRHAEIPRGPFRRTVVLPGDVNSDNRQVHVADGIVQIKLAKVSANIAKA
jgi:HSP20 family protein